MNDQPDNIVLRHLQAIRDNLGEVKAQLAVIAQGQLAIRNDIRSLTQHPAPPA